MSKNEVPLAYSRYTKTHWVLYVRKIVRVPGYTYRKKIKRRWRVVQVPAYRYAVYQEALREKKETPARWISRAEWLQRLSHQYENFDLTRSDVPPTNLKWFRVENNFLWTFRKWPPLSPHARYVLVILYFLVWDRSDRIHKIYQQRLKTIRYSPDMDAGKDRLASIESSLTQKFNAQKEKLERSGFDTEGVDVKGLAAWSVVPSEVWWIKEVKRMEKKSRYWQKRDRAELRKRLARERRKK